MVPTLCPLKQDKTNCSEECTWFNHSDKSSLNRRCLLIYYLDDLSMWLENINETIRRGQR